ncbi:hypothetical protein Tco_0824683 [Tanacetum coccineum]|uniref:Uncharacterized protein n=1 Tax=Tanacetum coccineum TaxID=301880 RepID=A0ABQ5AN92_9ASTR
MNQTQGNSKEVGAPRYLSLVVPIRKVGDEVVHKELGDKMERAATTAFSSEAEQDSGSGPRCQDTILGDVDAQTRFETTSEQSNDTPLSKVNTFGSGEDSMKILELMEIVHNYDAEGTDCLPNTTIFEELAKIGLSAKSTAWNEFSSTMASLIICLATNIKFNLSKYIFDGMVKHLDRGVKFLLYPHFLQVFINQQLGDMSHHKKTFVNPFHTKKIFANMKREGKDFSGKVTPLFDSMLVQATEEVGEDSIPPTDSTQIPIIDQPSTSSQPKKKQKSRRKQRKEAETAHAETEEEEHFNTPSNDPLPSGEDSMQLNELMALCTQLQQQVLDLEKAKSDQAIEIASLKKRVDKLEKRRQLRTTWLTRFKKLDAKVTLVNEQHNEDLMFDTGVTAGESVTTASVEDSDAPTIQVSTAAKPKVVTTAATTTTTTTRPKGKGVVVQEPSEFRVLQESQLSISKDKGKGIMVEPEVPLKRKDQIALDEQIARDIQAKLDAELEEEHKLARKQEEEANIALIESWENTHAMMKADRLLAERLQSKEREELIDEEKGKLFMELMEKRRKHFVALRAQEKRNRPPTKAQKRTQMSTYLKHMGGYTFKQLKGKNFDEIQKLFDKEMKRVNTFMAMGSEE